MWQKFHISTAGFSFASAMEQAHSSTMGYCIDDKLLHEIVIATYNKVIGNKVYCNYSVFRGFMKTTLTIELFNIKYLRYGSIHTCRTIKKVRETLRYNIGLMFQSLLFLCSTETKHRHAHSYYFIMIYKY